MLAICRQKYICKRPCHCVPESCFDFYAIGQVHRALAHGLDKGDPNQAIPMPVCPVLMISAFEDDWLWLAYIYRCFSQFDVTPLWQWAVQRSEWFSDHSANICQDSVLLTLSLSRFFRLCLRCEEKRIFSDPTCPIPAPLLPLKQAISDGAMI